MVFGVMALIKIRHLSVRNTAEGLSKIEPAPIVKPARGLEVGYGGIVTRHEADK